MVSCGVTEEFNLAAARIFRAFELAQRPRDLKANALEERMQNPDAQRVTRSPISTAVIEMIEEVNEVDRMLYA